MNTPTSVHVNGPKMRHRRKLRGLEMGDLAVTVGISPQRVSAIETNKKPHVRPTTFAAICDALGLAEHERDELVAA